jgi:hypothetical protein
MNKVAIQIDYKSGKIELTEINLIKYGQVLVGLMAEGNVEKVQLINP